MNQSPIYLSSTAVGREVAAVHLLPSLSDEAGSDLMVFWKAVKFAPEIKSRSRRDDGKAAFPRMARKRASRRGSRSNSRRKQWTSAVNKPPAHSCCRRASQMKRDLRLLSSAEGRRNLPSTSPPLLLSVEQFGCRRVTRRSMTVILLLCMCPCPCVRVCVCVSGGWAADDYRLWEWGQPVWHGRSLLRGEVSEASICLPRLVHFSTASLLHLPKGLLFFGGGNPVRWWHDNLAGLFLWAGNHSPVRNSKLMAVSKTVLHNVINDLRFGLTFTAETLSAQTFSLLIMWVMLQLHRGTIVHFKVAGETQARTRNPGTVFLGSRVFLIL